MDNLQFFDAHCYVGRYRTFKPGSFYSTSDLLKQMDYYGIAEALVMHSTSREHHPLDGNAAVRSEVNGQQRLHPSWALLPPTLMEMENIAGAFSDMIAKGVKAAKLLYGSYSFPLSEWCIGDLLDRLDAHHIPTFLDPDMDVDAIEPDKFNWDAVEGLCRSHPGLPVILSGARFRSSNRLIYRLMDLFPNIHLELSGYWANYGIELIVREFGASRLIFGTRMPVRDPGCAIAQLSFSEISFEEKKMIAGDNLRKLLGGVVE